ncbi:hypothetical protein L195_g026718 [Trifolium pratense]|uniref:Uncharacterized protein n=1 Tax=Trifolium pratense TaxID=57577 RepID=A0A2K3NK48_TRIPR|nr:hypothetical protein L195_g026718 [Trifolium pratense]
MQEIMYLHYVGGCEKNHARRDGGVELRWGRRTSHARRNTFAEDQFSSDLVTRGVRQLHARRSGERSNHARRDGSDARRGCNLYILKSHFLEKGSEIEESDLDSKSSCARFGVRSSVPEVKGG